MNNFVVRTLSAIVYAGLVIGSILLQPLCFGWHPLLFGALFMVVSALAVREFHVLVGSDIRIQSLAMICNVLLFSTLYFLFYGDGIWRGLLAAYVAVMIFALIVHLFRPAIQPVQSWGNLCAGQLMVAVPFALMNGIMMHNNYLLLALFVLIWVNDSGAYIVGSLTAKLPKGNHKMFPRVSPAKSWEGLVGGILFSLLAGYIFFRVGWTAEMGLLNSLLFACAGSIFGTLGDLMESLFKRTLGVKDSGKIMPGHGGVLDRFDSLLLAIPVVYLLFVYLPFVL